MAKTRVLFCCHGNICRSPMCEFVMKELVRREGLENEFVIASAATTTEEIGHDVHRGTKEELRKHDIPFEPRRARQLTRDEYEDWDYIVAMDTENMEDIPYIIGTDKEHKVHRLMEYCGENRDVADPWYTGNFAKTYDDVLRGCRALLEKIKNEK